MDKESAFTELINNNRAVIFKVVISTAPIVRATKICSRKWCFNYGDHILRLGANLPAAPGYTG